MVAHNFVTDTQEAGVVDSSIKYEDVRYMVSSLLTDGTDTELGGADFSSTNNIGRFTAGGNCVLTSMVIRMDDGDVAQSTVVGTTGIDYIASAEGMLLANTPLTNGFQIAVKRVDNTTLLDIAETVPIVSLYQLLAYADVYFINTSTLSATTTLNMVSVTAKINFESMFGKSLQMRSGDYFMFRVRDQTTGLSIRVQVFGYLIN